MFPGEDFPSFIEALGKLASMVLQVWTGGAAPAAFSQLVDGVAGLNLGGNRVHVVSTKKHGPVTLFAIVGDTGGADISDDTNGKDDTRIERICFAPMHITLSVPTKK